MGVEPEATPTVETTGVAADTPKPVSSLELGSAETMPAARGTSDLDGQKVGRFTIRGLLGRGGMGEVYGAHDPELDRMVAIKLLRPEVSTTRADARLRREARAMAKLSHRNLVTVHDVGVHDGQLFVAMELIRGDTLRGWAPGKSWREVVNAYVAAGRGLAAAHAAGLVHRDFKPDNVLVGEDGRVAVGDFGLAVSAGDDAPDGGLAGTVRYMAPEQLDRRIADERSDQFAFCVALWEALDRDPFGPFVAGEDLTTSVGARRAAMAVGVPRKIAGVPMRVARALARGLAIDPAARWASMTELVDHLDPARRRNLIALAVVAGAAMVLAVGATWWARTPAADPCSGVAAPMQDLWKPDTAQRLHEAFAATKKPYADDAATHTAAILEQRAAAWSVMRVESCQATARGTQTPDLERRRARCLDARLAEQTVLVAALTHAPSADIVEQGLRAALGLPAIESCANVSALLEQAPEPAVAAQLQLDVARADTLEKLGDTHIGPRLAELRARALALNWAPALARVDATIGTEAYRRSDSAAGLEPLREGATAAAHAKDDALGSRILSLEASVLIDVDRASDAVEVAHAAALLAARGGDLPELNANALDAAADAYTALSKFDDADRAYAAAVPLREQEGDRFDLASTLLSWSNMLDERSDYARALPLSTRAVELFRAELGEHHPDFGRVLQSNGKLLLEMGKFPEAKARFEQALAIKTAAYGDDVPTVAMTLHALGSVAQSMGDHETAGKDYERAFEIWNEKLGPDASMTLMARYSLGQNLRHRGKLPEAIAVLEDVLAKRASAKNPQPERVANTLDSLAECYLDQKDYPKALDQAQRALAIREKVLGPTAGDVAESYGRIADIELLRHDCGAAVAAARKAIAIANGDTSSSREVLVKCHATK
jgi:serine/threonine-protein kinase